MELIGKRITESQDAYDKAFKQLSSGSGNIIRRIEELKKMGAKANKQLGDQLLRSAEQGEDDLDETEDKVDQNSSDHQTAQ